MDAKWGQSGHNLLFTAAFLIYTMRLCAVMPFLCVARCLRSFVTVALARLGRAADAVACGGHAGRFDGLVPAVRTDWGCQAASRG